MKKGKIHDKSVGYEVIKGIVRFVFPKFFRQTEVRGLENIPEGEPLIFAGNHQNGVMDPVAIILYQKEPIVYMGRADIFSSKLNRILLRFIKVTPVYRIRDGYENLGKNDQQIKEAIDVLMDGKRLGVMPEGNHGHQHKLRPLVKGLFRIAYQAELQLAGKSHVKIVPVGIDYSFYQHAGSDLVLAYGKPIEVKDFLPVYLENPAKGLLVLRDELASALSEQMMDIRSANYERTYRLACYGTPAYLEHLLSKGVQTEAVTMAGLRFDARRALAKLLDIAETADPEWLEELDKRTERLNQLPGFPNEITEWMEFNQTGADKLILGLSTLILLPGFLLNFPAWFVNRRIVNRVEDKQMHGTFVFTLGMAFNLIVYSAVSLIIGRFAEFNAGQTLVLFGLIALLGLVSEKVRQSQRLAWRRLKYAFGRKKSFLNACKSDFRDLNERFSVKLRNSDV